MGENVRYLMHKYGIVNSDWSQNINILYSTIESYSNRLLNIEHKCTGSVIRELCETRDSCNTQFFERKELLYLIKCYVLTSDVHVYCLNEIVHNCFVFIRKAVLF